LAKLAAIYISAVTTEQILASGIQRQNEKSAQRDANTARVLAVVRFGHCPPAGLPVANTQAGPITIHCPAG